ncbi:hypothetical protein BU15DRAFT_64657 [Melanogaster broomeanus]|nr:hypothetical protein BU15DRAFT_64657 [Melanogaster broomeanus]
MPLGCSSKASNEFSKGFVSQDFGVYLKHFVRIDHGIFESKGKVVVRTALASSAGCAQRSCRNRADRFVPDTPARLPEGELGSPDANRPTSMDKLLGNRGVTVWRTDKSPVDYKEKLGKIDPTYLMSPSRQLLGRESSEHRTGSAFRLLGLENSSGLYSNGDIKGLPGGEELSVEVHTHAHAERNLKDARVRNMEETLSSRPYGHGDPAVK